MKDEGRIMNDEEDMSWKASAPWVAKPSTASERFFIHNSGFGLRPFREGGFE
jgi:hypothetical protein